MPPSASELGLETAREPRRQLVRDPVPIAGLRARGIHEGDPLEEVNADPGGALGLEARRPRPSLLAHVTPSPRCADPSAAILGSQG